MLVSKAINPGICLLAIAAFAVAQRNLVRGNALAKHYPNLASVETFLLALWSNVVVGCAAKLRLKFGFHIFVVAFALVFTHAFAQKDSSAPPLLPKQFAGWTALPTGAHTSQDPVVADPVNASLLKEYGFTDFEVRSYVRDDGRKLTVKAIRFTDASGGYGAFTYYRSPAMPEEKIGDQGASLNDRALFYRGSVVVVAVFDKTSAMSAAELRDLAGLLPMPGGGAQNLATFLSYLPRATEQKAHTKYVVGPVGLQKIDSPVPSELVDFSTGAEVASTTYSGADGDCTLLLISYPTPQIATAHLHAIDAAVERARNSPGSVPALASVQIFGKRTGPLVVLVAGNASRDRAQSLLASVNYEASVTWNEKNPFDRHGNIGTIVVNALLFSGIVAILALIAGFAFGGVRVLAKKLFPNTSLGRPDETEFISLHLEETEAKATDVKVS